jgi:diguanylate cyclase (GGDEF)-like protein
MIFGKRRQAPEVEVVEDWILPAVGSVARAALEGAALARRAFVDAIMQNVDGADGVLFIEHADEVAKSLVAAGARFEHFADVSLYKDVPIGESRLLTVDELLHPSDRSGMLVSMQPEYAGDDVAAIYVSSSRGELDAAAFEDVREFVEVAAPVYILCRAREQDQSAAHYDGLTGVLRADPMRARLRQLAEAGESLVFAFIDGDRFKAWNDRYGHASGDLVIQHLAETLQAHKLHAGDLVGRMGGDEFGIAFLNATKSDAVRQAVRICIALANADLTALTLTGEKPDIAITASIGVAMLGEDAADVRELLKRADQATYHSKDRGRDCVTYYERGQFVNVSDDDRKAEHYRTMEFVR